jgi:hypothetical protein
MNLFIFNSYYRKISEKSVLKCELKINKNYSPSQMEIIGLKIFFVWK